MLQGESGGLMSRLAHKVAGYAREVRSFRAEAVTPRDFLRIMRVRLALSKVGKLVCPNRITVFVELRSLGSQVLLRSHTTDVSVLGELISGGYTAALAPGDQPVRTIVDLGANTGLAARWLLAANPASTIVCVEPEAGNAAALRTNLARVTSPFRVFEACIGGHERLVNLSTSTGEFGYAMSEVRNSEEAPTVAVITMDRLLEETGIGDIDLLKCDIEGAERELFGNCSSWISRVRVAVVECHGRFDGLELVGLIARNGGEFEILDRQLNPAFECEVITLRNLAYR